MREDWVEIEYKDAVVKISTSKQKLKQSEYLQTGKIPVVDQGQQLIGGYTDDEFRELKCKLPAVIFGDHTKIIKLINFSFAPGADGTKVLEPVTYILPKYLAYLTEILVFKIKDKGYARHYQHIEKELLPITSLSEQRAIVQKIENLFASLDKGIADLKTAQQQLKVYRQAVLKKAFEGKLTNSMNRDSSGLPDDYDLPMVAERASKYNSQDNHDNRRNQGPNNLPKGWKWVKVEDSAEKIIDCLHSTPKFQNKGKYCIDTTCITNGAILWNKVRYVTEESFIERISRLKPQLGDVIFSREGTVGTTVVLNKDEDVCLGQRMMMFRLKDEMYPRYFMYYFQSDAFIMQYKPLIGGTTSPHLNIRDIKRLIVPICSLAEQHAIVREIESRLSVCDKVEQNIGEALEKAEALRQSILKKAFNGKLLSEAEIAKCKQEADYEPASALLKKIKKEKHEK